MANAYDYKVALNQTGTTTALRIALSVLALLAGGWLLVGWNDARLQTDGILLLAEHPPRAAEALKRFNSAKFLSASLQPEEFASSSVFLLGNRPLAIDQLKTVLETEPQNRSGWILLANWLAPTDPVASAAAFRRAALLNGNPH